MFMADAYNTELCSMFIFLQEKNIACMVMYSHVHSTVYIFYSPTNQANKRMIKAHRKKYTWKTYGSIYIPGFVLSYRDAYWLILSTL